MKFTANTEQEKRAMQLLVEELLTVGWAIQNTPFGTVNEFRGSEKLVRIRKINKNGLFNVVESVWAKGWKVSEDDGQSWLGFGSEIGFAKAEPVIAKCRAIAEAEEIAKSCVSINSKKALRL